MHKEITPNTDHWLSARRHGVQWNYIILQDVARVELYLARTEASKNKAMFDALREHRVVIEQAFGDKLLWERLDDKQASRISFMIEGGGLVDEESWDEVIDKAVDAMERLYSAFHQYVIAIQV